MNNTVNLQQTGQIECWDQFGNLISCYNSGQDGDLRCGVPWPNPRFIDNNNGTITDNLTGLIWLKKANCLWEDWYGAIEAVNGFKSGKCDLSDGSKVGEWRLPNINEIASLLNTLEAKTFKDEQGLLDLWLNEQGFIKARSNYYWSSTTSSTKTHALIVGMWFGHVAGYNKRGNCYVWPVRGGIQLQENTLLQKELKHPNEDYFDGNIKILREKDSMQDLLKGLFGNIIIDSFSNPSSSWNNITKKIKLFNDNMQKVANGEGEPPEFMGLLSHEDIYYIQSRRNSIKSDLEMFKAFWMYISFILKDNKAFTYYNEPIISFIENEFVNCDDFEEYIKVLELTLESNNIDWYTNKLLGFNL
ncbi:MAG: DUF1566 domain-containing protein [Nitrospirae bacterium]|nr:DUF1566 domain-containing protein [Nitrospirota bacterium]